MAKRKIIEIDRDKCNGCGNCTTACAEGALVLDEEGKAILVRELYCDGMGACLDVCPVDALHVIERDSEEYSAQASYAHVLKTRGADAAKKVHGFEQIKTENNNLIVEKRKESEMSMCGCPGSKTMDIKREVPADEPAIASGYQPSELSQWPIQLHLVSPYAPYFNECDLLVAADCTAFALGTFHADLLKGKKLAIACPKLDETESYVEKLGELIKNNTIYSLTVAIMSVPCCYGLYTMVQEAVEKSGKSLAVKKLVISPDGSMQ